MSIHNPYPPQPLLVSAEQWTACMERIHREAEESRAKQEQQKKERESEQMNAKIKQLIEADKNAPIVRGLIRRDYGIALSAEEVAGMSKEDLFKLIENAKPPIPTAANFNWAVPDLPWVEYRVNYSKQRRVLRGSHIEAKVYGRLSDLEEDQESVEQWMYDLVRDQNPKVREHGREAIPEQAEDNWEYSFGNISTETYRIQLAQGIVRATDYSILKRILVERIGMDKSHVQLQALIVLHPELVTQGWEQVPKVRVSAIEFLENHGQPIPEIPPNSMPTGIEVETTPPEAQQGAEEDQEEELWEDEPQENR